MFFLADFPIDDLFYPAGSVVVALLLGFVCGSIASGKGYSAILGFLLGFFLPLLGLIVCLVMPRRNG